MKYVFSEIPEGSPITLMLHNGSVHMRMDANIVNFIREDIAIIILHVSVTQILKFDNIDIEVLYTTRDGIPYQWRKAKIVYFKGNYVLQVKGDGARYNRRCTYRVGVSRSAQLCTSDRREYRVIVKDVSLTGFSITDRTGDVTLFEGDTVTISYEDLGHELELTGVVVRIITHDHHTTYGFSITRSCKDLPSYIALKQRRKRNNLPPSYVIDPEQKGDQS